MRRTTTIWSARETTRRDTRLQAQRTAFKDLKASIPTGRVYYTQLSSNNATTVTSLQLGQHSLGLLLLDHVFNLLELVEEIQALRVQQRSAGLDGLSGNDVLDGQLDLFAIDRGLSSSSVVLLFDVKQYESR